MERREIKLSFFEHDLVAQKTTTKLYKQIPRSGWILKKLFNHLTKQNVYRQAYIFIKSILKEKALFVLKVQSA